MGIRACCVRRDLEEERNLQKIRPNIEYEETTKENFTKVENGGRYCTEKTDQIDSDGDGDIYENVKVRLK